MHTLPTPRVLSVGAHPWRNRAIELGQRLSRTLAPAIPALDLLVRITVASAFFKSGLVKLTSWDATLALFDNVYEVPLLDPAWAAALATTAELALPVALVLGLGSRLAALGLFLLNLVAVISYPELSEAGLRDHQVWGLLLAVVLAHGPGRWSLDHLIARRWLADSRG